MKSQFIPYEHAKMMKDLGFEDVCYGFYAYLENQKMWIVMDLIKSKNEGYGVSAPLFQQAEEWLWEKHKCRIETRQIGDEYTYEIFDEYNNPFEHDTTFYSPIMAKQQGIMEAIEYLNRINK